MHSYKIFIFRPFRHTQKPKVLHFFWVCRHFLQQIAEVNMNKDKAMIYLEYPGKHRKEANAISAKEIR